MLFLKSSPGRTLHRVSRGESARDCYDYRTDLSRPYHGVFGVAALGRPSLRERRLLINEGIETSSTSALI